MNRRLIWGEDDRGKSIEVIHILYVILPTDAQIVVALRVNLNR